MNNAVDILIVGGGLIGSALQLALKDKGFSTCVVGNRQAPLDATDDFDARSLALSPASIKILETLQIWPLLAAHATPIQTIHVSEQGSLGHTRLNASTDALGHVIEIQHLNQVFVTLLAQRRADMPASAMTGQPGDLSALQQGQITAFHATDHAVTIRIGEQEQVIHAKWIVAADGAESSMRHFCDLSTVRKDYQQTALVANIGLTRSHAHVAYERFTSQGPMAMLPLSQQRMALVWALSPDAAQTQLVSSEKDFLTQLQRAFGYRLGRLVRVGQRMLFPLQQVIMPTIVKGPVVFIGNAARTLHPIAGQGFNLGLRDVAALTQMIGQHGLTSDSLARYQTWRQQDQVLITKATDHLLTLFANPLPGLKALRSLGLASFDHQGWLKKGFIRYASGYGIMPPDLACGIK